MTIHKLNAFSAAVGAALVSSAVSAAPTPASAGSSINPFSATDLGSGYLFLAEGKCGEGRCGGDDKAAKTTADKDAEGKCGEGRCGGDDKTAKDDKNSKSGEGKCGEGRCGA